MKLQNDNVSNRWAARLSITCVGHWCKHNKCIAFTAFTNFTIAHTITMSHFVHIIPTVYLNFTVGKLDMVIIHRYNDKFALAITQER